MRFADSIQIRLLNRLVLLHATICLMAVRMTILLPLSMAGYVEAVAEWLGSRGASATV